MGKRDILRVSALWREPWIATVRLRSQPVFYLLVQGTNVCFLPCKLWLIKNGPTCLTSLAVSNQILNVKEIKTSELPLSPLPPVFLLLQVAVGRGCGWTQPDLSRLHTRPWPLKEHYFEEKERILFSLAHCACCLISISAGFYFWFYV